MKKISRKSFLKLAAATTAGTAMAPALMGCAWPDTQDHTPYKGDIVLLLSNDIHSNLGTSKIMSTDALPDHRRRGANGRRTGRGTPPSLWQNPDLGRW